MALYFITLEQQSGLSFTQPVATEAQGRRIVDNEVEYGNTTRCSVWSIEYRLRVRGTITLESLPTVLYTSAGAFSFAHPPYAGLGVHE